MSWSRDNLEPVETLLFHSGLVKVGFFHCDASHPSFRVTDSLDNDVFVFACNPLWFRRNSSDYRFVEQGGVLLHRAGTALERKRVAECGDRAFWFGIHPDYFVESLTERGLPTKKMGGALISNPLFRYRLAYLVSRLSEKDVDGLTTEETVLGLFQQVCSERANKDRKNLPCRPGTASRKRRLADSAREFLNTHLAENIELHTVARAVGTSAYHLCRTFKEQTGLTLRAYRTRQRLGLVLDRVVSGYDRNFAELAVESGFCSHSHMSRAFQKHLGFSPSVLRSRLETSPAHRVLQA